MAAEPGIVGGVAGGGAPRGGFNACEYLLDRRVQAGDGGRLAITGIGGQLTYAQLLDRVQRTAAGLRELGLQPEQRLVQSRRQPA